jgi:hypothetical protein
MLLARTERLLSLFQLGQTCLQIRDTLVELIDLYQELLVRLPVVRHYVPALSLAEILARPQQSSYQPDRSQSRPE